MDPTFCSQAGEGNKISKGHIQQVRKGLIKAIKLGEGKVTKQPFTIYSQNQITRDNGQSCNTHSSHGATHMDSNTGNDEFTS